MCKKAESFDIDKVGRKNTVADTQTNQLLRLGNEDHKNNYDKYVTCENFINGKMHFTHGLND